MLESCESCAKIESCRAALPLTIVAAAVREMGPLGCESYTEVSSLLQPPCIKFIVSKSLGYGIVAGSAGVKLPQISKILKAGSVDGLSGSSIYMEMISSISSFAYFLGLGYPFSTWGENFFLFWQNVAIGAIYIHFTSGIQSVRFGLTAALSAALWVVLYWRMLPDMTLPGSICSALGKSSCTLTSQEVAGVLPIVIMLLGRVPQIIKNQKQGHAGQLALITYLLNVAGSGARVFTTLHELDDKLALISAASGFVQNAVLVAQILLLPPPPGGRADKKKADKKKMKKVV